MREMKKSKSMRRAEKKKKLCIVCLWACACGVYCRFLIFKNFETHNQHTSQKKKEKKKKQTAKNAFVHITRLSVD